jgi:hypothetical protein
MRAPSLISSILFYMTAAVLFPATSSSAINALWFEPQSFRRSQPILGIFPCSSFVVAQIVVTPGCNLPCEASLRQEMVAQYPRSVHGRARLCTTQWVGSRCCVLSLDQPSLEQENTAATLRVFFILGVVQIPKI